MNEAHHIDVVQRLIDILDALGIRYAIGGSVASSAYGTMRFTQDADIAVQPFSAVADRLYELLTDEFYVSREAMEEALRSHRSFNVIHFETSFKIDIFVQGPGEFEQQVMARSRKVKLRGTDQRDLSVVSPEDIVLLKLDWFRQTGGTSERQWSDVLGVLGVQRNTLDHEYLASWAKKLGVQELLNRAMAEAGT